MNFVTSGNEIVINAQAETNTASNLGGGSGVFSTKIGSDLQFRSLVAGTNMNFVTSGNEIVINSTATGGSIASITEIADVGNTALANGYLRWNATGTAVVYETSIAAASITGLATVATTGSYTNLADIPATFTPTAHTHVTTDITDLATYTGFDTRYFTESEITTLLSGKSDTGHTHVKADITDFSDADYATAAQGTLAGTAVQPTDSIGVLTDVNLTGLANGNVLAYNSVSGEFEPVSPATGGGATTINDLTDVDTNTVAPADGNVLTYSSATSEWIPAIPSGGSGGGTTVEWVVVQYQSGNTINPATTSNSAGVTVSAYDGSSTNVTGFTFTGYNMPPSQVIIYAQRVSVGDWITIDTTSLVDTPMKISDANGATSTPDLIDFNSPFTGQVTMGLPVTNTGAQNAGLPVKYAKLLILFTMAG
jgi:hypothetical protein